MRTLLLGAAAVFAAAAVPASADAQRAGGSGFTSATGAGTVRVHRGFDRGGGGEFGDEWRRDRDDRRDRRDRFGGGGFYWGDRGYQGDTLWRSDSFNDWWHERPQRSYPAWVARNKNCERMWWSGGDWRC